MSPCAHGRAQAPGEGPVVSSCVPIDPRRIEVIDDRTAAILRAMKPAERLERANQMVLQAREVLACVLRASAQGWNEARVAAEVRRRMTRGAA